MTRSRNGRSAAQLLGSSLLACASLPWSGRAIAGSQLPIPCLAAICGNNANGFVTSGAASAVQVGTGLTVTQSSNTATLNWASFNIGAGNKVVFNQPTATSVALNRIWDANPSQIFGSLSANGEIYLINTNGFLFGSNSVVNVGGLIASSLSLSDSTFTQGLLAPFQQGNPALGPETFSNTTVPNTGKIFVASGAQLTAADGGRLLLAAPTVENAGTLTAPDGQVILAAGQQVFLTAADPNDETLRGLIVQVDSPAVIQQALASGQALAGSVMNDAGGVLSAARGNITLTGLMVNQNGRISATTSVAANGSVTLLAANDFAGNLNTVPTNGGTLTIGPDSSIEILPEYADTATAVPVQTQLPSTINLTAQQIFMHGGTIQAPSGNLTVIAASDPSVGASPVAADANEQAKIRIDSGTTIDLAGSQAVLPMSANLVTVQLRGNELSDDPTQRNGALRGDTVVIDVRADGGKGTTIADVTSAIAAVGSNIAQRTETGGTATFVSEGDVVFNAGASINVSGGATTYQAGTIQTTALVGANGALYDIGSANPLLTYSGIVNPTFTQSYNSWGVQQIVPTPGLSHYEPGYVQGANAGSVQIAGQSIVLDGTIAGNAVSGPYQRGPSNASYGGAASGGTLTIGFPGRADATVTNPPVAQYDFFAPSIAVTANPTPIVVSDDASLPPQTLQLPVAYLTQSGFSTFRIASDSSFVLPAGLPLTLSPGANLAVQAPRIDLDSSIGAPSGTLSFESVQTHAHPGYTGLIADLPPGPLDGISVGNGVTLDVSGEWTNDSLVAGGIGTAPTWQNGGSITLQLTFPYSQLALGDAVALKADGGAWLGAGGTLTYGTGGSITLDASPDPVRLQFGTGIGIEAFGTGTAAGGTFALLAPRIDISQGDGSAWTSAQTLDDTSASGQVSPFSAPLFLFAPLFSNYGFGTINLTATGVPTPAAGGTSIPTTGSGYGSTTANDALTIATGTTISAETESRELQAGYLGVATGGNIAPFLAGQYLPAYLRPATNVAFAADLQADDYLLGTANLLPSGSLLTNGNFGTIDVQAGALIQADPGAKISLQSEGSIAVAGTLRAPGGSISLQTIAPNNGISDPGYVPTQGIDLAPTAVLDAGGTTILTPNTQGLLSGTVLSGGTVTLEADRGTVVAESGSAINVAGTQAALDVPALGNVAGSQRTTVASAGGSLDVSSDESISLLGSLNAAAGTGNAGQAAGGALSVALSLPVFDNGGTPIPGNTRTIELVDTTAGATPSAASSNIAVLGVAQLEQSGIDALTVSAQATTAPGNILIDTLTPLALGRQIVFDSPDVTVANGINASLAAPFVQIGYSGSSIYAPATLTGTGTLQVAAQQLNLLGAVTLQGITGAVLTSQGDVQLEGQLLDSQGKLSGSLTSSGNLTIDAARVYPATYTDFTLQLPAGTGTTLTIGQTTASPGAPLSADGALNLLADNISIGGTLLAPFGAIAITANEALNVKAGSLVSVSGAGLTVPFGQTLDGGTQWVYEPAGSPTSVTGVPTKQVTLTAPAIALQGASNGQAPAKVDLSGGGDLYAYEWVPGNGGTTDALALNTIPGLYAILPSAGGQAAPYDAPVSASNAQTATVYLSGGAGIAPGYYALLPPRYALLPGAILVQEEPSFVSATGGQIGTLANGTPVIGGYTSYLGTGLHAGATEYQGFAIYPGSYGQQLAAYTISTASSFFGDLAKVAGTGPVAEPADAGSLSIVASPPPSASFNDSLSLAGTVLTGAAAGGRGALINISAPDLEIVSANSAAASSVSGVRVLDSILQGWDASQLTLGGTTTTTSVPLTAAANSDLATVTRIDVAANTVTIDSGVSLTADQIDIVAQQAITVNAGATLASTSGASGKAPSTPPNQQIVALYDAADQNALPQAALLAVSDLNLPVVGQLVGGLPVLGRPASSGAMANAGTPATITLAGGATLKSRGALALDAPGTIQTKGATLSAAGASWSLSSSSIAFTGSGAGSADTLNIDAALLGALQSAGTVRLASASSIDIDAPSVLLGATSPSGAPKLTALTLIGSSINNSAQSSAVFGGQTLTLGGAAATSSDAYTSGTGTLQFVADTLVVGPGTLAINGFANTQAQVAGAFETQGTGGLHVGGAATINASLLTAAPVTAAAGASDGSGTTILATGPLTIGAATTAASGTTPTPLLGGALTLAANTIDDAGKIEMPSGLVTLTASSGNLHLENSASIDVSGTTVSILDQRLGSPGGAVTLSANGNVTLDGGSTIAVAGAGNAPAGDISIAGNVVDVSSRLAGGAQSAGGGGSFELNAGQSTNGLTALAANLVAGGFTHDVEIRVAQGDLDLAGGTTLTANTIVLTADTGNVDIAGVLSAPSAATRGLIELSAGNGQSSGNRVMLTGALHADAGAGAARGGEIEINSTCADCTITLANGSRITTTGPEMGELVLRAPWWNTTDVAINNTAGPQDLGAIVQNAGLVVVEPVSTYQYPLGTAATNFNGDLRTDLTAAQGQLSQAQIGQAGNRLTSSLNPLSVHAGVEIQDFNPTDVLTIQDLDLSQYGSATGQVIDLGVRAAGSITIAGTISDGFQGQTTAPVLFTCAAPPCQSGSLSFVAGADLGSANPWATLSSAASSADLTIGTGAQGSGIVRTGTGDLTLAAAHDVIFNGGAAYTAGWAAADTYNFGGSGFRAKPVYASFATGGGNVRIAAGADVTGAPVSGDDGDYSVTGWQLREGDPSTAALYGTDYAAFDWSTGALGGGDVVVKAGGQVSNLSAAVADSYFDQSYAGQLNSIKGAAGLIGSGGGLSIAATGDIGSAQVYVADGTGSITTGGGLTTLATYVNADGSVNHIGSSIALGNASLAVWARQGIQIDALYNPTYTAQGGPLSKSTGAYLSYGANSSLALSSTDGTVTLELRPDTSVMGVLLGSFINNAKNAGENYTILPGSLSMTSLQQDIALAIPDGAVLAPTSAGQITLQAARDITESGNSIVMADSAPGSVPTVSDPLELNDSPTFPNLDGFARFQGDLHADDTIPALVAAGRDVDSLNLSIPKAGQIYAGRDILDLVYTGQNLSAGDTTLISAGRDLAEQLLATGSDAYVKVGGPGNVDVFTGRNLNLGFGSGIVTVGNLENAELPTATGANLTLLVGYGTAGADTADFLTKIVKPSASYSTQLEQYVESLALPGEPAALSFDQAQTAFLALGSTELGRTQQTALIDSIFFNELLLSGRAANSGSGVGFAEGYAAIAALFPNSRTAVATGPDPYAGSLSLTSTQIYTDSGGNISILVPGGEVDVGLAVPTAIAGNKSASSLGIVAEGAGNVDIYTQGDVNVNSSRIFTVGGGNILIWSDEGNIDAGNGSKSSLSVPPPVISVDLSGNVTLNFGSSLATGSGIRTIQTNPALPAGNVDLDAPIGTVNAGDAGIGAAGNINIAAAHVLGVSNINFGGTATGVPADVSGLGASLSGVSSIAASSTKQAENPLDEANNAAKAATPLAQSALNWLDVFVTGLGEDNCKSDDKECLMRQKKATP